MKEVTRIHLAKTAYDIEVAAKKHLEKYVKNLELYTQDADVLSDIEIRMTEILAERSVPAGGVISSEDIEAIRAQLGEPHEFAEEGDIAVGAVETVKGSLENRRYYRDLDGAVLGGVLSGIATYFGFNPMWARIAFIIVTIMSWGAALLVYIVLWIAVPPARTAAERLQLTGKPVNLAAIRELNEMQGNGVNNTAVFFRAFFRIGFGIASILSALTSLIVTIAGGIGLLRRTSEDSLYGPIVASDGSTQWVIYILAVLSGILLTLFFSVLSYAILKRDWNKKMVIMLCGIVAAGIIASTSALTTGLVASWRSSDEARQSIVQTSQKLPDDFKNIKKLTVFTGMAPQGYSQGSDVSFKYVVDEQRTEYKLEAPKGIKPNIQINGDSVRISIRVPQDIRYYHVPELTVYGPAIDELVSERGSVAYTSYTQQDIKISSLVSNVRLYGEYGSVASVGTGDIQLNEATIETVTAETKPGSFVTIGVVRHLVVAQPDICPSSTGDWQSRVSVVSVSSGEMTYNGEKGEVKTRNNPCSLFVVGGEEKMYSEQYGDEE